MRLSGDASSRALIKTAMFDGDVLAKFRYH
jgi:hypothetical protein